MNVVARLAVLMMATWSSIGLAMYPSESVSQRQALIISDEANGPSADLANVLEQRYGFSVTALLGRDARLANIERAMFSMAEKAGGNDELLLHISLPILRSPELAYLPVGSAAEDTWDHLPWAMLQRWLTHMAGGPMLITFPGCSSPKESAYGDDALQELAYQVGKQRYPVEVLMLCDLESVRVQRRDPEAGFVGWRGEEVSAMLAEILDDALNRRSLDSLNAQSLDASRVASILDRIGGDSLQINLVTIPLHLSGQFRFVPVENNNAYESRYVDAASVTVLQEVLKDYAGAAADTPTLQDDFIAFAAQIGLSANAMAAGAGPLATADSLGLRRTAIRSLVALGQDNRAARDALVDILANADDAAVVRRDAVNGLASLFSDGARAVEIDALKAAAEDSDAFVRDAAIVGLAKSGQTDIADFLANAMADEQDARVRRSILLMLTNAKRAQDAPLFVAALADDDAGVRSQAVAALSALPADQSINQALLGRLAQEPDATVRTSLGYALGHSAPDGMQSANIEALVDSLANDPSPYPRVAMAKSLGELGGDQAIAALRSALSEDHPANVRIASAQALGELAAGEATANLMAASDDPEPRLRIAAIDALAAINTIDAANAIWNRLSIDEDLRVREAAQQALKTLPVDNDRIADRLNSDQVHVRQAAAAQVANSSDPAASRWLLEGLEDNDNTVQQLSISGLTRLPVSEYRDTIRDVFDNGTRQAKVNLVDTLGRISGDDESWATDWLIRAASSDTPEVKAAAVRALGQQGGREGLQVALEASRDRYALVRESAAEALGHYTQLAEATTRLQELAKQDKDADVRESAVRALSRPSRLRIR